MKNFKHKKLFLFLAIAILVGAVFQPISDVLASNVIFFSQGNAESKTETKKVEKEVKDEVLKDEKVQEPAKVSEKKDEKKPKYVFLFIGDGMSYVQVNAAQVFTGNNTYGEVAPELVNFAKFPYTGVATTQDSSSFCPDSASTATSIAGGVKTHSGVIGLTVDKQEKVETVAEKAKKNGMKVGIISSVTLNHATPAAFYAKVENRNSYYEIGKQMAASNFDYFGGGSLKHRTGKDKNEKDLYEIMKENGYKVTETKADFDAIKNGDKVYAVAERLQDDYAMPYSIDQNADDITLADFVEKGIETLDNEKGFFMMVESGKIDWACHANDAATTINEVLGLKDAVQVAIDFYNEHPEETLILVTGDHETGGLTIGQKGTAYSTAFDMLRKQKMSYVDFDTKFSELKKANPNMKFADIAPVIEEEFGLKINPDVKEGDKIEDPFVVTAYEYNLLSNAFNESMKSDDEIVKTQEFGLLYGGYNPITVTLTHILNAKAGIGWTSYAHTGVPVAVYAKGKTSENYGGYYDNTDIFKKMCDSLGFEY